MASAVTKKPRAKPTRSPRLPRKATRATKRSEKQSPAAPVPHDPLADIEEPDRSSPALAEVDAEALEFIAAIDRFKKENGRPFPSWSEILLIVRQLGYKRA
jgi:hypothetical protein